MDFHGFFFYYYRMTCYDKALSLLAIREHIEAELRNKLNAKGFSKKEIDEAIKKLLAENFLSDSRFCNLFIRSRLKKNPEGKSILIMRLRQKGISAELAKDAVDSYFEENSDEINEIFNSYSQKLITKKGEEKAKLKLYQKGIKLY